MELSTQAAGRLREISYYIGDMAAERQMYGQDAMVDVHSTALSFANIWNTLAGAVRVWPDGQGLSLGGVMADGTTFGMIAWPREATPFKYTIADVEITKVFKHGPVSWSFNS